jgi:MFS family permease
MTSPVLRPVPAATGPLWRDGRFATFWAGRTVSDLGDRISELAVPLVAVTLLHASSLQVGLLTAAVWAPNLLSLLTGAWVDQRPRKQPVLVLGDLLQAAALLTLPVAYWLDALTFAQLVVVALVAGAGGTLTHTAYQPFFVALVRGDQYVEANSLLSATRSGSFIAGPALGGLLVQVLTAPVAILLDAASFVVSALLTSRVRVRETIVAGPFQAHLFRRAGEGLRYVWRHPYLSATLRCSTTMNFFSFMVTALAVLYVSRILGLSAAIIGLAYAVGAVGGLVGAVVAPKAGRRFGVGRAIAVGGVLYSAPFAALPLATGSVTQKAAVLAAVELVSSAGVMIYDVNNNALQTTVTDDEMRSRTSGARASINYGVRPLGALVGGACAGLIGVGPTMVTAAAGGSLAVVWLLRSEVIGVRTLEGLKPPQTAIR